MNSSFRLVKHIGLKSTYRMTETYEYVWWVNNRNIRL